MLDHAEITAAAYAITMGMIWYGGQHHLEPALTAAVLWGGFGWFRLRRERRRRGPAPT